MFFRKSQPKLDNVLRPSTPIDQPQPSTPIIVEVHSFTYNGKPRKAVEIAEPTIDLDANTMSVLTITPDGYRTFEYGKMENRTTQRQHVPDWAAAEFS